MPFGRLEKGAARRGAGLALRLALGRALRPGRAAGTAACAAAGRFFFVCR